MVCIISLQYSLVLHYYQLFVLFHPMLHWFIIAGHGLHCFNWCFTGSSLMGIVCIISLHASRCILTVHEFYYFTSCMTGSSLLGILCFCFHFMLHWFILTRHCLHCSLPWVVLHRWASFAFYHFMLHWFILTGHCLYCFTSISGTSLLGMVCIVSLHSSRFILTVHGFHYFTSCVTGSSLLGMIGIASLHS